MASFGWFVFGLGGSLLFLAMGVGYGWTTSDPNEDYAILIVAALGIFVYLVSIVPLTLVAFLIERAERSPAGQRSRTSLTFFGTLQPILLVLIAIFVPQIVMGG